MLALGVPAARLPLSAMFLRKKPNKSGTVSVQIIDKSSGKYVVKETVGSSSDEVELSFLMKKGRHRIAALTAQSTIAFDKAAELEFVDTFLHHFFNQCAITFVRGFNFF